MGAPYYSGLTESSIRALVDNPAVDEIVIPAGVVVLSQPIVGRSHLTIRGSGRDSTFLVAGPNFTYASPTNAVIAGVGTTGFNVSDLSIDGNKVGWSPVTGYGVRLCGIVHRNSKDYYVERVSTLNTSGYAYFGVGTANNATQTNLMTEHGRYRDIRSTNANVHLEMMKCNDILVDGLTYSAGDGDMPCEAAVHPLLFGKRHTYRRVHGVGGNPGFNIVASGGSFDNIVIEDAYCIASTRSVALTVSAQGNKINNVRVSNSHFEAQNGNGTDIEGGQFRVSSTSFIGSRPSNPVIGLVIGAECDMRCVNTLAEARSFAPGQASYGVVNQNATRHLYFDGELRAVAKAGSYPYATGSSKLTLSPTTTKSTQIV